MKIKDWNKIKFLVDSDIEWPCPNCQGTALKLNKKKFFSETTAESKKIIESGYYEDEWLTLIFSGILECNSCGEIISMTGSGEVVHEHYYDQVEKEYHEKMNEEYTPVFFYPALHIFRIPDECPQLVKNEIIESFQLFWLDLSSCANKIRTSLELLLNEMNVATQELKRLGEPRRLSLHRRIEEYKKTNNKVADFLLAIKWIGNSGSHIGSLERMDLLDAYELLNFSLTQIYDNKESELDKLQQEINQRKGSRKK